MPSRYTSRSRQTAAGLSGYDGSVCCARDFRAGRGGCLIGRSFGLGMVLFRTERPIGCAMRRKEESPPFLRHLGSCANRNVRLLFHKDAGSVDVRKGIREHLGKENVKRSRHQRDCLAFISKYLLITSIDRCAGVVSKAEIPCCLKVETIVRFSNSNFSPITCW